MKLLLSWAVLTVAFLIAAKLLPGMKIKSTTGAIAAAAIFGVLNFALGWLLFLIFGFATLGLGFLFAGLTRFVVNVIMLKITDAISDELKIETTGTAIAAALIIAILGSAGQYAVNLIM